MKKALIVILGPTASGKTRLSIDLAKKFNGEIICVDSRSVYKKLDIGAAKPTQKEQGQVPHHLLDIAEPGEIFSVAQFQKLANQKIDEIFSRGKIPFLVGGSGLYIDSVIYGLQIPKVPPDWKLRSNLEKLSAKDLFVRIRQWDPEFAKVVDKNNKRRLIRAIEVIQKTHRKFSDLRQKNPPQYPILIIGIDIPREELFKKIDDRVDQRIKKGMIEEVEGLIKEGIEPRWLDNLGLEYRYLSRYARGQLSKKEAIEQLKSASHQFARRQETWFKKNQDIIWIKNQSEAEKEIEKFIQK
jgi:tRNA dimethylallyltransferase